jgi:hypothetical protein
MISKRIFWLACAAALTWLIWMRLRQQRDEFAISTPQFAPPRTFTPSTAQPDRDKMPTVTPAPAPPAELPPASPVSTDIVADITEADNTVETDVSGYCMRCKTKRPIQNAQRETTESGRPAARGTCPVCGANMFTFLATNDEA